MKILPSLLYRIRRLTWRISRPTTLGARVLLEKDGTVVLVKHTYHRHWYLPGGGVNKGETLEEYWAFTDRILDWGNGRGPNLILDDGGDATLFVHLGYQAEEDASVLQRQPSSTEEAVLLAQLKQSLKRDPGRFHRIVKKILA